MYNNIIIKKCTKCNQEKSIDNFYRKRNSHQSWCKECELKRTREWYLKNKEKRNKSAREWEKNNRDKVNIAKRKRRQNEITKESEKNYKNNKLKNDPVFAMKDRIRRSINNILKKNNIVKNSRTQQILGCNWISFKIHLEKQFLPDMTWDNRSEWHIDHIIPLSSAKTEDDVLKLNHFTNLRPLWAKDNLAKGGKVETLL